MSTCPACGVAVVPGYVKCPKCGTALPRTRLAGSSTPSGTVLQEGGKASSLWLVVGVSVAIAVGVGYVLSRGSGVSKAAKASTTTAETAPTEVAAPPPPPPRPTPSQEHTFESASPTPNRPDPQQVANTIDSDLKKQRLWGTVNIAGQRIDIRSAGCDDKAMAPLVDARISALHAAGLTKLRCLTQSGGVVFERDL